MTVSHRRRALPRFRRVVLGTAAVASAAASLSLALPTAALAQGDGTAIHDQIVSADPAETTPAVKDGVVESVVQSGNTIIIGGSFTTLVKAGGTQTYARSGLAAFDATTGAVSTTFAPALNGEVTSLDLSADGQSVYVGGAFSTVNGVTRKKVAQVRIADGSLVTGFKAKGVSARVADIRLVDDTLWIAGQFKKVSNVTRPALATLEAATGALTSESTLAFAGLHNGGTTNIRELAVSPDHSKLIAIGNFTSVNGQPRDQVAMVDLGGASATLSAWQTNFFTSSCSNSFDTFMRDVAISPDGSYAVFATTGAYRANTSCDTISRFELGSATSGLQPTWINMTGGDTTTAVAISGPVVYIGGHFRWVNNSSAGDKPGQGAVERTALAALNPVNGLPYDWNPTRERGYGVYDFLVTPQGLWVGSDTDTVGNEYHPRIALFPLAGGSPIPSSAVGTAPGPVLSVAPGTTSNTVTSTEVDDNVIPQGGASTMTSSDTWSNARGAMIVGGRMFTAWSDRLLYVSSVNGSTVGPRTQVDLSAGPVCTVASPFTGNVCSGNPFSVDVPNITGMFYDSGRMYYTMSTSSSLFYRYFEPGLGIVGSMRFTASGSFPAANVRGMFLDNGSLYYADNANSGRLTKVSFANAAVSGTPTVVDSSRDWRARGLALRGNPPANVPPTAHLSVSCTFLACTANAGGSSDVDGTITDYTFDFDEGSPVGGTQSSRGHTYSAASTYSVTVTVTDDDGATDTDTVSVTVSDQPASPVAFRDAATSSANGGATAKVTIPAGVQAGDALVMFVTLNTDATATAPAGWDQEADVTDGSPDMRTQVFSRAAQAGDAGTQVSLTLSAGSKSAVSLLAYAGVDASGVTVVGAAEPGNTGAHAAPATTVTEAGSWVVSYWADKGSTTPSWTVPGSVAQRSLVLGSGGGQVGGVSADAAGSVPTGTYAGVTATSSVASGKATSFTVVLPPA